MRPRPARATAGSQERVRFAGKEHDDETGGGAWQALDYFGARYLHSASGRFTSVDPVFTIPENLADPQRWNRYVYVRNNPHRYVDPDGRAIETLWDAFNVGMGIASAGWNLWNGNFRDAAIDGGGVLLDAGATVIPGLPGGAATALRSSRAARAGRKLLTQATRLADHHLLPNQFRKFFKDRDIDIDLFTVTVDQDVTHLKAIHGNGNMGQKPGHWNSVWAGWIADNPDATAKEIYQQLGTMMDDFGLGHLPIHAYRK
jgi:RHS repeat-associated protein